MTLSRTRLIVLLLAIAALSGTAVFVTIRAQSGSPAAPPANSASGTAGAAKAAVVNGETITVEELDSALGAELTKLELDMYNHKRGRLEAMMC